ncbi:peptidylprolyl isomerase [Beggiatoa leptomitoformis]|uniref:peptidylprolyl isomerase n=1 Tax=Beggiatoa leptomitoformis TaxID=288004 RepID=A0A2N9YEL9_9GAMM|nr:peptidylprolyl isomerase [Beggiatoa leptomitoformis]ALG68737.1 hypothetical protein AL038_14825 [Beggiatoa leptomitoformis]AUI68904.1 hypothetical protein BLE401_09435 [Beggiatoa leptomitoformis]
MRRKILIACLLSGSLFAKTTQAEESQPTTTNKTVATLNGTAITQQALDEYKQFRNKYASPENTTSDYALLEELISRELLVTDALKNGLDKTPAFTHQLEAMRKNLLVGLAMEQYLAEHPLDDTALRVDYEQKLSLSKDKLPQEFNVSHILVDNEAAAQTLIDALNAGKPFAELAKSSSKDTVTGEKGGELGWITPQQVTASFGDAMGKLDKGYFSQKPIQSEFGWHIIKINDKRPLNIPAFDSVKEKVRQLMQAEQKQTYLDALKTNNQIEILIPDTEKTTTK